MEKIQAAIAKARASRETLLPDTLLPGVQGAEGAGPDSQTAADPGAAVAVAAAEAPAAPPAADLRAASAALWAALPEFVPKPRLLARNHIVTYAGGAAAVTFDGLRTKLLHQMRAHGWKRVAITSPGAGCGKSTIALNLAFSLARQPDLRVLLIELDLRRPSLARTLGFKARQNFSRVIEGVAAFEDHAFRIGANLAVTTNQGAARHPAELLSGAGTAAVLAGIEARYHPDLVIFDMPPMLVTDDTMAFAGQLDCALLVAAAEASTVKEIDACERELASQTNVVGVVLNKCRYLDRSYGYGYYA